MPAIIDPNNIVAFDDLFMNIQETISTGNDAQLSAWLNSVSGTDNCTTPMLTNNVFSTISACGNTESMIYEFISRDDFGNELTCFAEFTIEDTTDPVIDTPAANLTVECSGTGNSATLSAWLNDSAGAVATDLCNEVTWSHDFTAPLTEECDGGSETTVTFTATDDCGNTSTTQAVFTIEDTTPPTLECPTNITLECNDPINDAVIENWLNGVNSFDTCSEVTVENDFGTVFTDECGETALHTITFTATDDCGNTTACIQTITLEDTTAPTIEAPAQDLLLECSDANNDTLIAEWEMNNGGAIASDDCSDLPLVWTISSQVELLNCGSTSSTLYTFLVTDNCSNTSTTQASVIIEDTSAPVLMIPVDEIVECENISVSIEAWLAEAEVTDDCGADSVTSVLWNTTSGCGGTESQTYLFTATDACGNETTGYAEYTIVDTSVPTPVCPAALALTCGNENNDQIIAAWINSGSATDAFDCSAVNVTTDYPGQLPFLDCDNASGIVITFTATDACDNSATCTSVITMSDATAPVFSNCPLDLTVNVDVDLCETNVVYSQPIALDDCDDNVDVVLTSGIASGIAFPIGTTAILFTATDNCGNETTCQFDITVVDSEIPSISCPSNDVEVCTDPAICTLIATDAISPVFADNCTNQGFSVSYTVTGETTAASPLIGVHEIVKDLVIFNLGTSEVCYTITDEEGNSASCCFDVVVEDCEAPTLTCSDELNVECGEEDLSSWFDGIAATMQDNCMGSLSLDTLLLTDISSCGSTFERIYLFTATDEAGNANTCLATYETDDIENPVITDAIDLTIECNDGAQSTALQAWLNSNGGGTFTSDNCSTDVSWTNDFTTDLITNCGTNGAILVTFTATDDCGNTTSTTATFTIEDTTPPVIECPIAITLECGAAINDAVIANWLSNVRSEDACEGTLTIINNYEEVFVDSCGLTGIHEVTFTSVDACMNLSTCESTITIEDTTDPEIIVTPQDLELECDDANNDDAIAAWEANFGGAVAEDACSDEPLVWAIISQVSLVGCGSTGTTEYTFEVTDNCGNTYTTTATVIVDDTTAPELVVPVDLTEECNDIVIPVASWIAQATASDACGDVAITNVLFNTTNGCGSTETRTYLFTATDDCGNETTRFADYIIADTGIPTIVCPPQLQLVCGSESNDLAILNWLNAATATDENGCSDVSITTDFPSELPLLECNTTTGTPITFTVVDDCGNSSSCVSTVTMDDDEAPFFSNCPLDMTVNVDVDLCTTNVVYSQPIAMDDCDERPNVSLIEGVPSGNPFPLGLTTITFETADACGNTSTCSFDITVVDSDTPSVDCPSNDLVVCTDEDSCTWLATDQTDPSFNDNCPSLTLTYAIIGETSAMSAATGVSTIMGDNIVFELGESEVQYTISDPSGNMASCQFKVIVEDCQNPEITCNDVVDVACGTEDVGAWFDSISATITDNCDVAGDMFVDSLLLTDFSSCGATFERVYIFTVTDQADNQSSCIATYESDDTIAPVIDTPAESLTIECEDGSQSTALLAWLSDNGGAVASDLCSNQVTWTNDFVNDLTATCGSNGAVDVIFTVTDDCGNASTTAAIFIIEDTTPPVLSCPDAIVLECTDNINDAVISNWLRTATAIDGCHGTVPVTNDYPSELADGCGMTGVHTVIFTTVDACSNLSECIRTVTIIDRIDPTIVMEADDLELSCGSTTTASDIVEWLADNGGAIASDACSDEPLVWEYAEIDDESGCGGFEAATYLFTVTDNCGNTSATSASVIISDDTDPEFDRGPIDQFIECYPTGNEVALMTWLNNNGGAIVTDDCATDLTWEFDLINVIDNCGNTLQRDYRFTVTDDCGNTATAEASFIISDTTDPEITADAEDITVECNGASNSAEIISWLNNNGGATATDRCGDITWTNDYGNIISDCGETGGVLVTFTATDDCGNFSTSTARFIINDEVAPVWELQPQNLEVECDGSDDPMGQVIAWLNIAGGGEAEDDCSLVTYTNDFSIVDLECDMEGGVVVVFTATDACGNATTASALMMITDDVPPIVTVPAQNMDCLLYTSPSPRDRG